MKKKIVTLKVYSDGLFKKEVKDIIALRRSTIDRQFPKEISFARLAEQMTKEPEWLSLKSKLLRMPRKEAFK